MATNGGVAVVHPHVPAWKRLGLKLKYASDLPVGQKRKLPESEDGEGKGQGEGEGEGEGGAGSDGGVSEGSKKEKRRNKRMKRKEREHESSAEEEEDKDKDKGEKKKRRSKKSKDKDRKLSDVDTNMEPEDGESASSDKTTLPPPPDPISTANKTSPSKSSLRKRSAEEKRALGKSVSFTADTKATDGDSIKTLYQNHDPFAHYDSYQQHISNYPTNELPEGFDDKPVRERKHQKFTDSDNEQEPAQNQRKEKTKKQKRKDPEEEGSKGASAESVKPQLSYLLTYHTSREVWRFEKSKQNWILRNAFNPVSIPQEGYADALKSYIAGIQGAAARDRLLAEANEIVKHGKDTISKDGEKLNVEDQKTSVTRAKLVLAALGHGDDEDEEESGSSGDDEE